MLASSLKKFSPGLKKRELTIPKIYLSDPGLYNYLAEKDFSKSMENSVFLELVKQGLEPNIHIFYYKTKDGKEIDLIVKRDAKLELIEVAYELDEEHINKVKKAMNELNLKKALIVTWDEEENIAVDDKEIRATPLWKFVLS